MLKFKKKSRVSTLGKRKGKTLYYAQQQPAPKMTLDQVENAVVQRTSLAKGDVRNAIASLADIVNESLLMGMHVDLGDLGSIKIEATSAQVDSLEEVTARIIRKPKIRHYPKAEMASKAEEIALSVEGEKKPKSGSSMPPAGDSPMPPSGSTSSSDGGL